MNYKITGLTEHFSLEEYSVGNPSNSTITITEKSLLQAQMLEEFRKWYGKSMKVNTWYRTPAYNKAVGGIATSHHLYGTATDIGIPGLSQSNFIKYCKQWKKTTEAHGVVGEAGLYTWGMHIGISNNKTFSHWDSRTGVQKNNPFAI